MKIACFVVLTLALANISFAEEKTAQDSIFPQQMTAKDLMFSCASSYMTSKGRQRKKYCSGFISGVEESARLFNGMSIKPKICLPEGRTASQYTEIYISYASRKTTDLSKPAALVVIEAFQDAFPCPASD